MNSLFLFCLSKLFCFCRIFLEEAIAINSQETSVALQHVASSLQFKDLVKLADFMLEKVLECTTSSAGTALAYR